MPPEYLFDYLRCYFTFSFFLLEVHLKVVKACSDNLIRLIIVNEVFSVLKYWLKNLTITILIYAFWVLEYSLFLLDLKVQEIFNWEEPIESIVMLQKGLKNISLLVEKEEPETSRKELS